jgi:hypothetical protein
MSIGPSGLFGQTGKTRRAACDAGEEHPQGCLRLIRVTGKEDSTISLPAATRGRPDTSLGGVHRRGFALNLPPLRAESRQPRRRGLPPSPSKCNSPLAGAALRRYCCHRRDNNGRSLADTDAVTTSGDRPGRGSGGRRGIAQWLAWLDRPGALRNPARIISLKAGQKGSLKLWLGRVTESSTGATRNSRPACGGRERIQ